MKTIKEFLETINKENEGFSFGKPWRYNDKSLVAILPILRECSEKRNYITFSEAKKIVAEDSGSIDTVLVTNNEKTPIFIRAGEIFKGKTQERAVVVSRIVMPGATEKISVVCIHASRGINIGAKMEQGGVSPSSVQNAIFRSRGNLNLQQNAWGAVSMFNMSTSGGGGGGAKGANGRVYLEELSLNHDPSLTRTFDAMVSVPSDDLKSGMEEFSKTMEEIFRSVPKVAWQSGAVLIGFDGVKGLEVFDLADSWTSVREEVVRKNGEDLSKVDKDSAFEFKAEKAKKQAQKVIGLDFGQKDLYKDNKTQVVSLDTDQFVGEATIFEDKVIHLTLLKK